MGIVKIATNSLKDFKLINAKDLKSLKSKAEDKFKIQIEKFVRRQDGCEIDDDEIFIELMDQEELQLIALQKNEEYTPIESQLKSQLHTSSIKSSKTREFESELKSESKQTNSTLRDLDEDDEEDGQDEFFKESNDLKNKIKAMKIDEKKTEATIKKKTDVATSRIDDEEILDTKVFEKKKKEALEKIKKEEEEKLKYKKRKEELESLSTTLKNEKIQKEEFEKEYNKKLFESKVTKEMSKTELQAAEARLAELQLKKHKISNIFIDLIKAEKVDICFLVDCTGSMSAYINEVKTAIHRIVDKLKKRFKDFELRCSFVGYRDHSDGKERVSVFDFVEDIDGFKAFVSSLNATGGADQCEDIFGGLEEVAKQNWSHMSRVLFHIGDAPCHGNRFHNGAGDDYPDGDPRGLKISDLIKSLVDKQINYYFAEINSSTLKMIEEFDKELFAIQGNKIKVVNLKAADELADTVATSIVATISESKSMSMHSTRDKKLKTIIVNPKLNWSEKSMKKSSADYYTATYDGTVTELKTKSIEFNKKNVEIYISAQPFAKGCMRYAYSGYLNIGTSTSPNLKKVVIKQSAFSDDRFNTMKYYTDMIETQVISKFLTDKFLETSRSEKSVRFIDVNLINVDGTYYSIEDYLEGDFVKWMNNAGNLNEDIYACTLDTFSHWSYQATNKYLIVTDLQGFTLNGKEYILTDPAISCPESHDRFSSTNLGVKGINKYFESHQCNHMCKSYRLEKHKSQKLPDRKTTFGMTKLK